MSLMFVGCKCINIMTIEYAIYSYDNNLKLFGEKFVDKNKKNGFIILNGKKQELCYYLKLNESLKKNKNLEIKLVETKTIRNMSEIFYSCSTIIRLPDISLWNMRFVSDISYMFDGCSALKCLPNISKWSFYYITDMNHLFCGCRNLESLPDISKWDTKNVTNMSYMFYNCSSLKSLPDISIWDTKNVTDMSYMFYDCSSLISLPDISKWELNDTLKKEDMLKGVDKKIIPKKFKGCLIY